MKKIGLLVGLLVLATAARAAFFTFTESGSIYSISDGAATDCGAKCPTVDLSTATVASYFLNGVSLSSVTYNGSKIQKAVPQLEVKSAQKDF